MRSAAAHGSRLVAVFDVAFAAGAALPCVALRWEGGRLGSFRWPDRGTPDFKDGRREEGGGWKRELGYALE